MSALGLTRRKRLLKFYCSQARALNFLISLLFIILIVTVLRMASFFIRTDKPLYTAGDTVTGEVLMAVPASISGCQGISLRLAAFECLKWVSPHRISQPPPSSIQNGSSQAPQPLQQLYHTDKIQVSECASEQKSESGLRPRLIRTAKNEFYQLQFHEKREELALATARLMESSKLVAGQYSFPFSFKTLQQWPGSLNYHSQKKKAQIQYKLTACIDPVTPHYDFEGSREVVVAQRSQSKKSEFHTEVASMFCIGKGTTTYSLSWGQQSYSTNDSAELSISIDNSRCSADIKSIFLSLVQAQTMEGSVSEEIVWQNEVGGVRAGEKRDEGNRIVEIIDLSKLKGLLATTHGKIVTSQTKLNATLQYDALFFSSNSVSIPINLHSAERQPQMPLNMQKDFKPKIMPACALNLQNSLKAQAAGEKLA